MTFVIPLFSIQKDASEYFTVNSTTGYLYQTKQFDYEESTIQCGIGKEGGFLNITAEVNYIYISQLVFKSLCKCKLHIYIMLFNSTLYNIFISLLSSIYCLSLYQFHFIKDGLHKTSKSLSVTFINIDDAPPVFVNSDCSNVCLKCPLSSLSAFVHITHQVNQSTVQLETYLH